MSCSQGSMVSKTSKCKRYREKEQTTSQSSSTQHYIPNLKAKQTDKNYHNDSIQTCSSDRSLKRLALSSFHNHKVELCKNYISKGYCPYQNRCRFAHGVEQLRARDADQNSQLYRTRKCKVFFEKGECRFGQRCNFRHENRTVSEIMQISREGANYQLRSAFPEVFMNIKMNKGSSSRLMTLLNLDI